MQYRGSVYHIDMKSMIKLGVEVEQGDREGRWIEGDRETTNKKKHIKGKEEG